MSRWFLVCVVYWYWTVFADAGPQPRVAFVSGESPRPHPGEQERQTITHGVGLPRMLRQARVECSGGACSGEG